MIAVLPLRANKRSIGPSVCQSFKKYHVKSTDKTVIEDEKGLKSVGRLVQSKWLIQTGHMGSHFTLY